MDLVADWLANNLSSPSINQNSHLKGPYARSYSKVNGYYQVQVCATAGAQFYRLFGVSREQLAGIPPSALLWSGDLSSVFIDANVVQRNVDVFNILKGIVKDRRCLRISPCDTTVASLCCRVNEHSTSMFYLVVILVILAMIAVILMVLAIKGGFFSNWRIDVFNKPT